MNSIKKVTAFFITLVLCIQTMAFNVFAEEFKIIPFDEEFHITGKEFIQQLNTLLVEEYGEEYELDFLEGSHEIYGAYIAKRKEIQFTCITNIENDNLKAIQLQVNVEDVDDVNWEYFAIYFALATYILDEDIEEEGFDYELEKNLGLHDYDISTYQFAHNNVIYMRDFDENLDISFYIFPNFLGEETATQQTPVQKTQNISVVIDGNTLISDVAPQNINGRTMVPMRSIFESLGATITWNAETKQAVAVKGDKRVTLTLNSATAYINGEAKTLESPAISYNGYTLVPARFVAEAFGANVTWDGDTKTVYITSTPM